MLISRSRAFASRIELKIGSNGNSGSPGKYICVTSRSVNARPKSEKWMWFGRQALGWFFHGYAPGLTVDEPVPAVVVGQAAPGAGEVRVERRVVGVDLVPVAAGGVGLPDLDQLPAQRLAVAPEDAAADDDPLARAAAPRAGG